MRGIDPDMLADELRSAPEYVPVPDYAFDCHTRRGKAMGKTKADFFQAEQAALRLNRLHWCRSSKGCSITSLTHEG
jgi:hypothetical protein